jgi:hypothetical protein
MNEQVYRLLSIVIAAGIIVIIHRLISKPLEEQGSETRVVLSLDALVVVVLVGALVKNDILDLASSTRTNMSEDLIYLFSAFSLSIFIYSVFAWARK